MLDPRRKAEMTGGIERPHEVVRLLHDEANVLQARPRAFLQDDIVRIVLPVQQRTADPIADARVAGNAEAAIRIER